MFDHHCPFISNCVGRRNYVHFWFFVNLVWVNTIYIIWIASTDIERRRLAFGQERGLELGASYAETFKELPLAPLVILFCAFAFTGLTVLVVYHYFLALSF